VRACVKERCIGEGALVCVKEHCVKERGGDGTAVRGEGEWLACLVLMCVLVDAELSTDPRQIW
jgi:hypothetical protein